MEPTKVRSGRNIIISVLTLIIVILVGAIAYLTFATSPSNNSSNSSRKTTTTPTPINKTAVTAFKITSIDMAVNPNSSISNLNCGSNVTVSYTATFHAPANTNGGKVDFTYTTTNGRGTTPASITFAPGETSKTYTFTWSGTLEPDNVYPGQGGIMVTNPNQITSSTIAPTGKCISQQSFKVTSIALSVDPNTISGNSCNSTITLTYTATFNVSENTSGGTINFMYTTNNGRSSTNASITLSPGETSKSYTFSTSGKVQPDHTFPGIAEVITTTPNAINSSQIQPTVSCP